MTLTIEQQLAVANALVAEQEQRIKILEKRIQHIDVEMAQARVSRDTVNTKLISVLALLEEAGITVSGLRPHVPIQSAA